MQTIAYNNAASQIAHVSALFVEMIAMMNISKKEESKIPSYVQCVAIVGMGIFGLNP